MEKGMFFLILTIIISCVSACYAGSTPSDTICVTVINKCSSAIIFHVANNSGSMPVCGYMLAVPGSKDDQNTPIDRVVFIFTPNNDKEIYTITYKTASCAVNYPLIKAGYSVDAIISGCDSIPNCTLQYS